MRPFLPPLAAGAAARADAGLDFEGSGYAFLESPGFLAAVLVLAVLSYALQRVRGEQATLALAVLAAALGALLFAGSLAAGGDEPWPGLPAGAACAALGFAAAAGIVTRARRRLDDSAAALLPVWGDLASLALAAVAIAFPPAALVGLAALAYVLVAARRAGGRKYEGLRVLR